MYRSERWRISFLLFLPHTYTRTTTTITTAHKQTKEGCCVVATTRGKKTITSLLLIRLDSKEREGMILLQFVLVEEVIESQIGSDILDEFEYRNKNDEKQRTQRRVYKKSNDACERRQPFEQIPPRCHFRPIMDALNNVVRSINSTIDVCTDFVQTNVIQIGLAVAVLYFLQKRGKGSDLR